MKNVFHFEAELWEYGGQGSWFFVTLPETMAKNVREIAGNKRAFGSVKVLVVLGKSKWLTSLFPDNKTSSFVLPLKKSVRSENSLEAGSKVSVAFSISDR